MCLIFQLGTCHSCGLNCVSSKLRAEPHVHCKVHLTVYFFFHGMCKPCNNFFLLVTPLMKGQAQNVTWHLCSSLLFIEYSLTYYPKFYKKHEKMGHLTAHTYKSFVMYH